MERKGLDLIRKERIGSDFGGSSAALSYEREFRAEGIGGDWNIGDRTGIKVTGFWRVVRGPLL